MTQEDKFARLLTACAQKGIHAIRRPLATSAHRKVGKFALALMTSAPKANLVKTHPLERFVSNQIQKSRKGGGRSVLTSIVIQLNRAGRQHVN